jgi:[histone H3]-lysine36 N-trimethyltransferase
MECPENCPMGEKCFNQNFSKKKYQNFNIISTDGKGYGILAETFVPKGTFIIEYTGEIIDEKKYKIKKEKLLKEKSKHLYFMEIKKGTIIDATVNGNEARLINHSCDPNCETQYWEVNGMKRVGIFSIKDINKGVEFTYDYRVN